MFRVNKDFDWKGAVDSLSLFISIMPEIDRDAFIRYIHDAGG
jgi:hypothetical protein